MNEDMKKKRMRVYVDIGSHNKPFMFSGGMIADSYPTLLQVYHKKITSDLRPAILEFNIKEVKNG